ncbi:TPA: flavodoxin family protein [Streptococcus pneumoniae]
MNKIFIYAGVQNHNSKTLEYTKRLSSIISSRNNVDISFRTPFNSELEISNSDSEELFKKGIDRQSNADDGGVIKKELLESDIIIISSPVYLQNVSVDTKNFIERIGGWSHLFRLAGKFVVTLDVTESNGSDNVSEYLRDIFSYMGGQILHQVSITNSLKDIAEAQLMEATYKIEDVLEGKIKYKTTDYQERAYQTLKLILENYDSEHFEKMYWEKKRLFEANSLEEWYYVENIK